MTNLREANVSCCGNCRYSWSDDEGGLLCTHDLPVVRAQRQWMDAVSALTDSLQASGVCDSVHEAWRADLLELGRRSSPTDIFDWCDRRSGLEKWADEASGMLATSILDRAVDGVAPPSEDTQTCLRVYRQVRELIRVVGHFRRTFRAARYVSELKSCDNYCASPAK